MAAHGKKALDFAVKAAERGAIRFPDCGNMESTFRCICTAFRKRGNTGSCEVQKLSALDAYAYGE